MNAPDPLLPPEIDERPPPHPALTAFKRVLWIILTLLIILSLVLSMLVPILQRRNPRRDPENEIQAHWISNEWAGISVQYSVNSSQQTVSSNQYPGIFPLTTGY